MHPCTGFGMAKTVSPPRRPSRSLHADEAWPRRHGQHHEPSPAARGQDEVPPIAAIRHNGSRHETLRRGAERAYGGGLPPPYARNLQGCRIVTARQRDDVLRSIGEPGPWSFHLHPGPGRLPSVPSDMRKRFTARQVTSNDQGCAG